MQSKTPGVRADPISFNLELVLDEPLEDDVLILYPGDYYYFYIKITNTGDNNDSYQLSINDNELPSDWAIRFADKSTDMEIDVSAAAFGSNIKEVLVSVNIPETAKKDDSAHLKVTAISKTISTVTHNVDLMITVNYLPPYVILETAEPEKEVIPGGTPANFVIKVTNLGYDIVEYIPPEPGEFELPDDWTIHIYAVVDPITLEPAEMGFFEVNISAPDSAGVKEKIKLTIEGRATSLNTTILPVELFISVKQIHDIELSAPTFFMVLSPSTQISFDLLVSNNGNGFETLDFDMDMPSGISRWIISSSEIHIIVPVDGQYPVRFHFTPPADAANAVYEFTLNVKIMDIDTNTVIQTVSHKTSIEIRYVPDLAIDNSDIRFSSINLEPDQTTVINATIHNFGIVTASNVTVQFISTTKAGSQKLIGTVEINEVPPGGNATASIEWKVDPATSTIQVLIDPDNTTLEINEKNNLGIYQSIIIMPPTIDNTKESQSSGGILGIGTVGAAVVLTALISITSVLALVTLNTEAGRYGLLSFFMPLYSKMRREDLLLHETREMVYDYVKSHPGEHFRSIMNKLSLTNGTLAHHLYTLEKQEFIKSERDGPYKRFYPRGYTFQGSVMEVNGIQKKILDVIEAHPGITQKRLAAILSVSPPTVNYHIKTLVGARLVELQRNGKETRCHRIQAE